MHRRSFLQGSLAATSALTFSSWVSALPPDDPYLQNLGLQLYTLRNQLATDIPGTIQRVAKAGFAQVELMDVLGADEIVAAAQANGLKITSSFFDWRVVAQPDADGVPALESVIEKARELGVQHLVFGYIGKDQRQTLDDYKKIADRANQAAEKIRAAGMEMCYHNHSFEFEPMADDTMGFEVFTERFDEKLIAFELDVFWVAIGGWSPVEMMNRLKGRVRQLHLKDIKPGTQTIFDESQVPVTAFQEVGDGLIDFAAVLNAAKEHGIAQCHVEQDQSPDPLSSIEQSYGYLKELML